MGSADLGLSVNSYVSSQRSFIPPMDELQTWADVADRIRASPRGAKQKLARALNMDPSYLYRRLNHAAGQLTVHQSKAIARFFENLAEEVTFDEDAKPAAPRGEPHRLAVYGYAAGSEGELIALNEGQVLEWLELPHGLALMPGDFFVIRPIGSSMEPRIFPGDTVVVRRNYPPARDKDVVIEFTDGSAVIKTYQGQRSGRVFAKQWNEEKTLDYDATKVRAMHAVAFKL